MDEKDSRILIVGHDDIIENSLFDYFRSKKSSCVFSSSKIALDTTSQNAVNQFFQKEKIQYVFLASTRSGGIVANQEHPAEFIYHNLESQNNIIHGAYRFGVKKLLFFAGSCVYPKETKQPLKEEYLLTGPLEETSEAYSVAKIAGIKLCEYYKKQYGFNALTVIPATIYGPGSNVNVATAHVIGALIGKFSDAKFSSKKEVVVWGTGLPRREFIFIDDFISAAIFLMEKDNKHQMINVGCGQDISIKELALLIKNIVGFKGKIIFDKTKPDGTMKKLMNNKKITQLGWKPKVSLEEGIKETYAWYQKTRQTIKS